MAEYSILDELLERGVTDVDELTEDDLIKLYNLYASGQMSIKKIAEYLGLDYNKLRRRINQIKEAFLAEKLAMSGMSAPHPRSRRVKAPEQPMPKYLPNLMVEREIASNIVSEATDKVKTYIAVGKMVTESLLTEVIKYDHRLAEMLKKDPSLAILRYVQEMVDLYTKWPYIRSEIDFIISRYESLIRKLYNLVKYLLPRASPFIRYEVEVKLALDLIDRLLLMKILGIKLPSKLPQLLRYYSDIRFLEALEAWEKKALESPSE